MNRIKIIPALLCFIATLYLILIQCSGGFKSDSPNSPEFEDSVFGRDSGR